MGASAARCASRHQAIIAAIFSNKTKDLPSGLPKKPIYRRCSTPSWRQMDHELLYIYPNLHFSIKGLHSQFPILCSFTDHRIISRFIWGLFTVKPNMKKFGLGLGNIGSPLKLGGRGYMAEFIIYIY